MKGRPEPWLTFGAELQRRREDSGLSLRDLAKRVNYSFGYLGKLERGQSTPTLDVARRLDAELGMSEQQPRLVELAIEATDGVTGLRLARPAQLPPGVADFIGRTQEWQHLDAIMDGNSSGSVRMCLVEGLPGVGKTALVVRWAHTIAHRFPDGQVFVDLRGWGRDDQRRQPGEVLEEILRALGVPSEVISPDLDKRTKLYRSVLAGKGILVVWTTPPAPTRSSHWYPGPPVAWSWSPAESG
ncbi:helix-turn-helix domain-containing protein [Saccharopolyspora phatthalungensis]|nr:helix-turn-helix domain-containing protein [Saccharopolyspora phatthalungensis]